MTGFKPEFTGIFIFLSLFHTIKKIIPYFFAIGFLLSCKKENALDCFRPNGDYITSFRQTGPFNTIKINNKIDATILPGPEYKVEIVAGRHIINNISAKVTDGVLNVENNNTCNFVRGYKKTVQVKITVPYIKLVFNDGVGAVRFDESFQQDTLLIRAGSSGDIFINGAYNEIRTSSHGNGDIYINGTANSLYVYAKGTNFLNAQNLRVKNFTFIETYSIGDCHIDATGLGKFDYNIHSSGNIYYTGMPGEINNVGKQDGTGRAIKN